MLRQLLERIRLVLRGSTCWYCSRPIKRNQAWVQHGNNGKVHKRPCHYWIVEEGCYFCDDNSPITDCKDCCAYEYAKEYFGEEVKE